jgi:hypothetical protein
MSTTNYYQLSYTICINYTRNTIKSIQFVHCYEETKEAYSSKKKYCSTGPGSTQWERGRRWR